MAVTFQFEKNTSPILGTIYRPIAQVFFHSEGKDFWHEVWMLVDTGADYSLLPRYLANKLGVNIQKNCKILKTVGIGGAEKYIFLRT